MSSCKATKLVAYAVLSVAKSLPSKSLYEAGIGWDGSSDIEGVYLTLCLRHIEILQPYRYFGLELSNDRCPGCDYIKIPWRPCKHRLYPFGHSQMYYIGLFAVMIFISAWALTLSVQPK